MRPQKPMQNCGGTVEKSGSSRAFHVPFVAVQLTNPTELVPLLLLLLFSFW